MFVETFILLSIVAVTTSCERDDGDNLSDPVEKSIAVVEDETYASETFNEVEDIVDEAADENNLKNSSNNIEGTIIGNCATVIIEGDSLDATITVDFGDENCECEDGRLRRGKIIASYTGNYWADGKVITYTMDNYFVDNNQVTGTKTITRFSQNENGNRGSEMNVDGSIILEDGEGTITWKAQRTREVIQGTGTLRRTDDVYEISGTSEGITRDGEEFSTETITPLERKLERGCRRNYVDGKLVINPIEGEQLSIDYGDGVCNRFATVTIGGEVYTVFLR